MELEIFEPEEKMMMLFCESCQEVKAIPSRRGRPPKYCTQCTDNGDTESNSEVQRNRLQVIADARCDRLEMMLRSRNTHIKQQQSWYQ